MSSQVAWDVYLICQWYKTPNRPMWAVKSDYRHSVKGLIRTATGNWEGSLTCRAYICKALPELATVLWEESIENAYEVALLIPEGYERKITWGGTLLTNKEEREELKKSSIEYRRSSVEAVLELERNQKYSACKLSRLRK